MIYKDNELQLIKSKPVSIFEGSKIVVELERELASSKTVGVGLSAIQIGRPYRVCIIRSGISLNLINPEIVYKDGLSLFDMEGCLSFPGKFITTKRYSEIVVKDLLHPAGIILCGFDAVVVEHEIAHMDGETMFDYQINIPKGRNDKCWCGSGKKFKSCHINKVIK